MVSVWALTAKAMRSPTAIKTTFFKLLNDSLLIHIDIDRLVVIVILIVRLSFDR